MVEGTDGRYYLQAGAVVIAGSWRLEDKMGLPLEDIHTTGNVPQCMSPSLSLCPARVSFSH